MTQSCKRDFGAHMVLKYRAYKIMQKRNLHTLRIKDTRICTYTHIYGSTTQLLLSLFPTIGNMRPSRIHLNYKYIIG